MSRKCPKRHHLFLNWLRANRSRFFCEPRVTSIRNNRIFLELQGISNVLRFDYYCRLAPESCSWLSVDVSWQGMKKWDGLAAFFGAEIKTDKGWITLGQPEEIRRFWQTREELWTELCFEAFLAWCNRKLTPNSWLELSEGFGIANAEIRHDHSEAAFMSGFRQLLLARGKTETDRVEIMAAEVLCAKVPLFKKPQLELSENVTYPE